MSIRNTWARARGSIGLAAASLTMTGVAVAAAGAVALAGPAMADTCPAGSSCATANVTVQQVISFSFTSGTSFSLDTIGTVQHNALLFNVVTNDSSGYSVSVAAPDLVLSGGASTIPAADLAYDTWQSGQDTGFNALSNTAAQFIHTTVASNGTPYAQDWKTQGVLGSTHPGSYATTLSFIATGN